MANPVRHFIQSQWYKTRYGLWHFLMWPFELLFHGLSALSRIKNTSQARAPCVPVIVVGNIHVGGMGKSPVVQALACALALKGKKVGVLLRGYGASPAAPMRVTSASAVEDVGDEALMHAHYFEQFLQQQDLAAPIIVCVDPKRVRGAFFLAEQLGSDNVDFILCDDGLQHYQLKRDCEIVLFQGNKGAGLGHLLPRGPLREPLQRLLNVDFILSQTMLDTQLLRDLPLVEEHLWLYETRMAQPVTLSLDQHQQPLPPGSEVVALAGIAQPENFFKGLQGQGYKCLEKLAYPDHYKFTPADYQQWLSYKCPIVMTAKDAVKLKPLLVKSQDNPFYVVPYSAVLEDAFVERVIEVALRRSKKRSL